MRRGIGVLCLLALSLAGLAAAGAFAHTHSFPTTATLTYTPSGPGPNEAYGKGTFSGSISAGDGCKARRDVNIEPANRALAEQIPDSYNAVTDGSGHFSVGPAEVPYEYSPLVAIVQKKTIKKKGHVHTCKKGRSGEAVVPNVG